MPLSGSISLSSDVPNVKKTIWSTVDKVLLDEALPGLLPFIPFNIHVGHNAFLAGLNTYGDGSEELAIDLFYWLNSPETGQEWKTARIRRKTFKAWMVQDAKKYEIHSL